MRVKSSCRTGESSGQRKDSKLTSRRHVKEIIEELGLEGAKPADTPRNVSQSGKIDSDSRALSLRDATLYRRLVVKLNYLAMDRATHSLRCIEHGESRTKRDRCGYGQTPDNLNAQLRSDTAQGQSCCVSSSSKRCRVYLEPVLW